MVSDWLPHGLQGVLKVFDEVNYQIAEKHEFYERCNFIVFVGFMLESSEMSVDEAAHQAKIVYEGAPNPVVDSSVTYNDFGRV